MGHIIRKKIKKMNVVDLYFYFVFFFILLVPNGLTKDICEDLKGIPRFLDTY